MALGPICYGPRLLRQHVHDQGGDGAESWSIKSSTYSVHSSGMYVSSVSSSSSSSSLGYIPYKSSETASPFPAPVTKKTKAMRIEGDEELLTTRLVQRDLPQAQLHEDRLPNEEAHLELAMTPSGSVNEIHDARAWYIQLYVLCMCYVLYSLTHRTYLIHNMSIMCMN